MAIRLHTYPDGHTGLAAFCDVCGEQITENGFVVWKGHDDDQQPIDVLIIHQARCDPGNQNGYGSSMALDVELIYLANSVGADLDKARRHVEVFSGLD